MLMDINMRLSRRHYETPPTRGEGEGGEGGTGEGGSYELNKYFTRCRIPEYESPRNARRAAVGGHWIRTTPGHDRGDTTSRQFRVIVHRREVMEASMNRSVFRNTGAVRPRLEVSFGVTDAGCLTKQRVVGPLRLSFKQGVTQYDHQRRRRGYLNLARKSRTKTRRMDENGLEFTQP